MGLGGTVQGPFVSADVRTEATLGLVIGFNLKVNKRECAY